MGSKFPKGRLGEADNRLRSDAHGVSHVAPFVTEGLQANAGRYILDSSRALATIAARTQLNDEKPKAVAESTQASKPDALCVVVKVTCYSCASPCQELFS
jgi:hypothetical protein